MSFGQLSGNIGKAGVAEVEFVCGWIDDEERMGNNRSEVES